MSLTLTDLFCGAGGSAQGAHAVPGIELRLAANHWQLAVDSHAENFPDADHMVADISQVDPRRVPRTDLLWASPECTNHSQAKGVKRITGQADLFGETLPDEAAERSRATMWDVPRFAERHAYRAIVVENVVDAAKWVLWDAWLMAMTSLGYAHQLVSLNSMHAPAAVAPRAPQSRDRLYIVFTRAGDPRPDVAPRPLAHCTSCDSEVPAVQTFKPGRKVGRYRQQYLYRCPRTSCRGAVVEPYALPAAHAIDWTMPGQRIGDRAKPLSAKTLARIEAGLIRYAGQALTFEARGNTFVRTGADGRPVYARAWPVSEPTATLTTTETRALVVPVEGRDGKQVQAAAEPMRTMTTRSETALVVPYYGSQREAVPAGRPMPTMGTVDTAGVAFIAELRGGGSTHRPVTEPLATMTASGTHHMLVRHNTARGNPGQMCTPTTEVARTITTAGHQSLVGWPHSTPAVDDCTFRMLEPHEIQKAMAFGDTYRVLGNRRERVRQLGNAVTPPAAEFLLSAVATALDGAA
ncbi:DNA cytosine methyltransferase [Modestobacter sp. VKM Ac-2985]|uniref:DNA cytosine methyltransferase n=1 Tax=Modestobacter sp. VKM Ac-2985 TaxID=3004139 RepID=UPI0022AB833C|nr:DNA cytosine methyltransferase [Modestobacter sp. VKM Ac-2985]MCZ2837170.1 DNA cytosine methyltransferase [Modestobacter sp. VKM Ac-2985]